MLRYLLALLTLLAPAAGRAQAPGWGWVKYFGQSVYGGGDNSTAGVGRDAAGNLYVAGGYVGTPTIGGQATTNEGGIEAYLAKYDPAGTLLWLRALHGPDTQVITKLVVEPSGRCTIGGIFGSGASGGPFGPGSAGGNLSFTEFNSSLVLPGPVQLGLPNGGNGTTISSYNSVPFLATVDAGGTLVWATCPSPYYYFNVVDMVRDVQGNSYLSVTTQGTQQLAGTTYPAVGGYAAVLLKYNAAGQAQWVRRAEASGSAIASHALRTDQSGAVYWTINQDSAFALDHTPVTLGPGIALVKLTPGGSVRWIKNVLVQTSGGRSDSFSPLIGSDASTGTLYFSVLVAGGGIITYTGVGSPVQVPATPNSYTQYVVQCDSAGQVNWVKPLATLTYPAGGSLGASGILQLFPTAGGFTLLTRTVQDGQTAFVGSPVVYGGNESGLLCVAHYNNITNQTDWTRVAGTAPSFNISGTQAASAVLDPAGNVFVAGTYAGPARFGAITLPSTGGPANWVFLAKLDQTVLPARPAQAAAPWSAYPNPATGQVQLAGLPPQAGVQLLDALGRVVRRTPAAATSLSLTGLAPGLYLLQVSGTSVAYQTQRLVVE